MPCPSPSLAIVTSMGFDNGSGYGQSQAGAACPATARAVGAVEAAEDVGKVCGVGADLSERSDRARHGRLTSRFSAGLGAFSAGLALFTPEAEYRQHAPNHPGRLMGKPWSVRPAGRPCINASMSLLSHRPHGMCHRSAKGSR